MNPDFLPSHGSRARSGPMESGTLVETPVSELPASKFAFRAIGVAWEIETARAIETELKQRILDRVEGFDATYSRFRSDSLIRKIGDADTGGTFDVPVDAIRMFDFYDRLHAVTDGAVDPLVGRDLELLGYDAHYSLEHDPDAIARYSQERRNWHGDVSRHENRITTQRPVVIDVGAAGKGYLVDIIADMLSSEGHKSFVVDGSGDLRHAGDVPLDIGLEHPFDPGLAIGVAHLMDRALCASAVNRRAWGAFHHVIDARTGVPVEDVVATWVVATDTMIADGLATALFFTEPDRLAESFDFAFVRMFADGRAQMSSNFNGELFN